MVIWGSQQCGLDMLTVFGINIKELITQEETEYIVMGIYTQPLAGELIRKEMGFLIAFSSLLIDK